MLHWSAPTGGSFANAGAPSCSAVAAAAERVGTFKQHQDPVLRNDTPWAMGPRFAKSEVCCVASLGGGRCGLRPSQYIEKCFLVVFESEIGPHLSRREVQFLVFEREA